MFAKPSRCEGSWKNCKRHAVTFPAMQVRNSSLYQFHRTPSTDAVRHFGFAENIRSSSFSAAACPRRPLCGFAILRFVSLFAYIAYILRACAYMRACRVEKIVLKQVITCFKPLEKTLVWTKFGPMPPLCPPKQLKRRLEGSWVRPQSF